MRINDWSSDVCASDLAVQYRAGRNVSEYVKDAGGTQFSADKGRIYVVYPNGLAQPVKNSVWRGSNVAVPPGTTVIVPKNLDPLFKLELVQNIVEIGRASCRERVCQYV